MRYRLILSLLAFTPFLFQTGATHYVPRSSGGGDGTSWNTAWGELSQIDWSKVHPGDTILLDGGPVPCPDLGDEPVGCGMVYNTPLNIGQSGVTVALASAGGRNGTAILDGNQTGNVYCAENAPMPLPPRSPSGPPLGTMVSYNGRSGVTLDGGKWGGIVVRNATTYGINLGGGDGNTVRYVKVHHINNPGDTTNNSVGITMGYTADVILLEHVEIYRNGQDAIRGTADDLYLRGSYIHDLYCNHPDAIQAFVPTSNTGVGTSEQVITGLVIEGNVIADIGLQGIFLGENGPHQSWADGVVIRNNLLVNIPFFIKAKHTNSRDWLIEGNTLIGSSNFAIEWCCASPGARSPMVIRNNILRDLRPGNTAFYLPTGGGNTTFSGNCVWNSGGIVGQFSETGTIRQSPTNGGCAGKGSPLGGAADLVGTITHTPTHTPSTTPIATGTNSATPVSTPTPSVTPTVTPTGTAIPPPSPTTSGCWDLRGDIPLAIPCDGG